MLRYANLRLVVYYPIGEIMFAWYCTCEWEVLDPLFISAVSKNRELRVHSCMQNTQ